MGEQKRSVVVEKRVVAGGGSSKKKKKTSKQNNNVTLHTSNHTTTQYEKTTNHRQRKNHPRIKHTQTNKKDANSQNPTCGHTHMIPANTTHNDRPPHNPDKHNISITYTDTHTVRHHTDRRQHKNIKN